MALRTAVTLGNKQFLKSIDQMERRMGGFTSFMRRSSRTFAAGSLAIGAGLGLAVKAAGDFEQSMANMDSVANTTGAEFARLRQLAFDMSTTTMRSATEAAGAMYELASAGQRAEQIFSTLPSVIKLADATQYDLSQTTSTVVATMNAFGLEASDTERIINVMAASIGGSMAKMDKLSASFAYIGPVARSAGLSIEETSAALMVLYNAGLDGSAAGTSLRRILASLLKPTESLTKRIEDLGLEMSDIDPRVNSMSEIMQTLKDSGLDATAAFEDFGLRGAPALLALLAAGDGLDEFETMITGTDRAAEMLARQMDAVGAQATILKNTLITLGIKIGEKLLPMVRDVTGWLQRLLEKFDGLSDSSFELIAKIALLAGGLLGVLSIVGRMAPLLGAAAGPIGILAIAVGALATAYVLADKTMSDYYDALRDGNAAEAEALRNKTEWAAMMKALFSPEYWEAVGSDIFIFFQRLGAGMSAFFAALKNDARLIGEAFDPKNWIDPDWRRQFAESFQLGDVGQLMSDAWENAPVDLPEGATSWTADFYDRMFTPPADAAEKIVAGIAEVTAVAAEALTGGGLAVPMPNLLGEIADVTDETLTGVEERFRAMRSRIEEEMQFAGAALTAFMVDIGQSLEENIKKEKSFTLAMVKTVGKAYADLVEKFAMKAVTNTLMAQAETVGILSMQGLFDWSAWAKIGPAIAKGAATIALIKAIKGRLGFHTGGPNYQEGFKFLKSNELVMDRSTVQRGGYGRATLDAAGEVGMGTNVSVVVNIAHATMTNPEVDARAMAQIIGDEVEALLNGGA